MTTEIRLNLMRRARRNRKSAAIRALVRETELLPSDLIAPLFLIDGKERSEPIESMPGVFRLTIDRAIQEVKELFALGVRAVALFPVVPEQKKNAKALEALNPDNLMCRAIKALKDAVPEMCLIVDIALDPYTDHGHDGLVGDDYQVLNDPTVKVLAEMAVSAGKAGVDIVAPSDMMDGRIAAIRQALDEECLTEVSILSYAVKYASALYGPFRDALHSAPKFGDKKAYQMDPANIREASLECALDEWEGADFLLIKPALAYLDVIAKVKEQTEIPVGAYHVSGEYAMIMAAAQNGWIDGEAVLYETLLSIKRAGASFILTYGAHQVASRLQRFS